MGCWGQGWVLLGAMGAGGAGGCWGDSRVQWDRCCGGSGSLWDVRYGSLGHYGLPLLRLSVGHPRPGRGCWVQLFAAVLPEDNSVRPRWLLEAIACQRGVSAQICVVELVRPGCLVSLSWMPGFPTKHLGPLPQHNSDVSAYTYEQTLMLEQRSQTLLHMWQAQVTSHDFT